MRFDDRLRTVLKGAEVQGQAAVIQYRQLMDLIGRTPSDGLGADSLKLLSAGLMRLHALHDVVSKADRVSIVQSLSGQLKSMVLLRYLLADHGTIANAAIKAARLSDSEWEQLVPEMSVMARGALRHRRDLGPKTVEKLTQYGVSDHVLIVPEQVAENAVKPDVANAPIAEELPVSSCGAIRVADNIGDKQGQSISEIVQRIEAFRASRHAAQQNRTAAAEQHSGDGSGDTPLLPFAEKLGGVEHGKPVPDRRHAFSVDVEGRFTHADGVPIGALFGLELGRAAFPGSPGVDAALASAFQRRAPIHKGRLTLAGGKSISGIWLMEAQPVFAPDSGRFSGYHGFIRRPEPHEQPDFADDSGYSADSVRQLVHELRTPLGAITGFSEIIEQQLFGPVSLEYRALAANISRDAHFLLAGFDDLDTALKLDRGVLDDHDGLTDVQWLQSRIEDRLQPLVTARQCRLKIRLDSGGEPLALSHQSADRIFLRLGGALISIAAKDEKLRLLSEPNGKQMVFWFDKPRGLFDINDDDLFDTEFGLPDSLYSAPLLGLGFTLRLVRSLVAKHGGEMLLDDTRLGLSIPVHVQKSVPRQANEAE